MEKKEISLKDRVDSKEVVNYLEDIIAGLNTGTLCIQSGCESITLKPSTTIQFEIEASTKKDKGKLNIELSWSAEKMINSQDLKIMSSEPEPEMEIETETEEITESTCI